MSKSTSHVKDKPKATTRICLEQPADNNPYQAQKLYVAGYDIEALADKTSISDMYFLMFTGQLSTSVENKKLLETLFILLSMPGPRHMASRAAMTCGVSKSNPEHLLPISLITLGGKQLGAAEVGECYQFINEHIDRPIKDITTQLVTNWHNKERHIAPGFGQHYGAIDPLVRSFMAKITKIRPDGKTIKWAVDFLSQLAHHQVGLLDVGLAAIVLHQLSFGSRESIGLYQLMRAPGLLAYAMEQTHKPISAMPMLEDSQVEFTEPSAH